MKKANQKATVILEKLFKGLKNPGDSNKFENSDVFTPVSVSYISDYSHGKIVAVTHYSEQNGDAMSDPDIIFLRTTLRGKPEWYPMEYRNDFLGMRDVAMRFEGEKILVNNRLQNSIKNFVNTWMENIKHQQF